MSGKHGRRRRRRAAWLRQARGYSLAIERGHLARHTPSGTVYHSTHADPERALRGLRAKLKAQGVPAEERDAARALRAKKAAEEKARQLAGLVDRLGYGFVELPHFPPIDDMVPIEDQGEPTTLFGFPVVWVGPRRGGVGPGAD